MGRRLEIQSIGDIITNSSSETFVIEAPGMSREDVRDLIEDTIREMTANGEEVSYSGDGGSREVYDSTTKSKYDDHSRFPFLPDGFYMVDIDWSLGKSIWPNVKKKASTIKAIDVDDGMIVVDGNTGETRDIAMFVEDDGLPEDCFITTGGKWVAERSAEYYGKVIEETLKEVEELERTTSREFLRKVQSLMNKLDDAESRKKSCTEWAKFAENEAREDRETWEKEKR